MDALKMNFIEYKQTLLDAKGDYKKKTECACWHCAHTFEGIPKCVPVRYVKVQNTWSVVGIFCSWACAKAWQTVRSPYNTPIQRMYLLQMAKEKFGYPKCIIHPAPEPWILKYFGGTKTIEEFRAMSGEIPTETIHPPLLPACMAIVQGTTNDVIRQLSATRNDKNATGKNDLRQKKGGVYDDFLKKNSSSTTIEKKEPRKKRSSTKKAATKGGKATSLSSFMMRENT